ncbi:MarR family winged helix-turn-helix transcriptional regulator [Ancylobacter lacus]|uniref:MarR family winged helix-turn-helix transcriptional regulator n=1 Tax=Ancylobacter lacus TaxID=2579970 RepID=UPI001BCA937F|nr:MarR family transcriptional regulator [Ancylobacter lacus]MBS7540514.1 MarR family transcriptional regulator [Ancylobacter lacus]
MTASERDGDEQEACAYPLQDQIGYLMRVANQRLTAIFANRINEGLTPPQFSTLVKLREVGPCSQNRLGRLINLDAATIKGIVDRLCNRGLVTSTEDTVDRRRRAVRLTERGRDAVEQAIRANEAMREEMLAPLTQEEREQLLRLLKKLG